MQSGSVVIGFHSDMNLINSSMQKTQCNIVGMCVCNKMIMHTTKTFQDFLQKAKGLFPRNGQW